MTERSLELMLELLGTIALHDAQAAKDLGAKCREALAEQPAQYLSGLAVYLDPNDGLKPKRHSPQPAQPQQEPVAWVREHELPLAPGDAFSWVETFVHKTPLYTSPPANANAGKPWVGLTGEEKTEGGRTLGVGAYRTLAAAFDAGVDFADSKLREKNAPASKPLTDEEMKKIWYAVQNIMGWYSFQEIARAIESAHGIKGDA